MQLSYRLVSDEGLRAHPTAIMIGAQRSAPANHTAELIARSWAGKPRTHPRQNAARRYNRHPTMMPVKRACQLCDFCPRRTRRPAQPERSVAANLPEHQ